MSSRKLLLGATLLAWGCSTSQQSVDVRPASARDTTRLSYALTAQYRDSVEQAQMSAFFAEYNPAALEFRKAGNLLGDMELLRDLAKKYPSSAAVRSLTRQQIGTYLSFLGDDQGALREFDSDDDDPAPPDAGAPLRGASVDAVDAIVAVAESARVIFVNEAHHVPRHRALTLALLPRLRAMGFSYLAAETLSNIDSTLNERGYPLRGSGFYSIEPVFGELLRTAHRLGFKLVPYESSGSRNQDERELGQARNLQERILATDSTARIIVHAGYAHINESGLIAGVKPMAVRFRELTGIDPVTVDQTLMRERGRSRLEHPLYGNTVQLAPGPAPFVLREAGGQFWSARPGRHDMTVITPRTTIRDDRPSWLWNVATRRTLTLPSGFCNGRRPCAISARAEGESELAIPVDAVLWDRGPTPPLVLPIGRYRVTAQDRAGAVLRETTLTVPGSPR